jgi:hypothetical protein
MNLKRLKQIFMRNWRGEFNMKEKVEPVLTKIKPIF